MSAPPTSYAYNPPMTSAVDGTIDGFFDHVVVAPPVQASTSTGYASIPTPRSPGIGPPQPPLAPLAQPHHVPAPAPTQSYPPPQLQFQPHPPFPPPPQPQPPVPSQPLTTPSVPHAHPSGQPFSSSYLLARPCRTQRVALDFDPWRDADLCLRSRDGTLIPCHGANLASASPLLAHLVTSGAAEEARQMTDGVGAGGAVEVKEGLPVYDLNDDGNVLTVRPHVSWVKVSSC